MQIPDFPAYPVIDAVDLRPFDNRKPDYGMADYIETLGYIPQVITLLENSIEQIHSHNGVVDNSSLPYLWCAERAMPGGNVWSKRQLYGLVEQAHRLGIRFYMGVLGAPNQFAEYNTRAEWLYAHPDWDIFVTRRDGGSQRDTRGDINPLRRLPNGRFYEDALVEDLLRYLEDYHMDGFYGGDGWCGLNLPLSEGDYHPDMVAQFEEATGIKVPGGTPAEHAAFLWDDPQNRPLWTSFYAERWAALHKKLHSALHARGKEFIVIDPWARGPVDALYDFGFDYRKSAPYLDALCLEAREENWGHRGGEWLYVWETGERVSIPAIQAMAPGLKLYWAACTCNAPEHWTVVRDCAAAIERQSLSLPLLSYIDEGGRYRRALEGLHLIFGTDLTRPEWDFLRTAWDFSFGFPISRAVGPAVYWSDAVHAAHFARGVRWELTAAALNLVTAGLPVHSAVSDRNLAEARCDGYLLVDPIGITDGEVEMLLRKREEGAALAIIGEVVHPVLLEALGIERAPARAPDEIYFHPDALAGLGLCPPTEPCAPTRADSADYRATTATVLASLSCGDDPRVLLSINQVEGKGPAIFARRRHSWPEAPARGRYFQSYKDFVGALPDQVDKLISDVIARASNLPVRVDHGQLYVVEGEGMDYLHVGLGNMGNIFSALTTVTTAGDMAIYDDYPFKRHTPAGYLLFDSQPRALQVKVPMDGSVQLKLKLRKGDRAHE